jgi:hypothetical protein
MFVRFVRFELREERPRVDIIKVHCRETGEASMGWVHLRGYAFPSVVSQPLLEMGSALRRHSSNYVAGCAALLHVELICPLGSLGANRA